MRKRIIENGLNIAQQTLLLEEGATHDIVYTQRGYSKDIKMVKVNTYTFDSEDTLLTAWWEVSKAGFTNGVALDVKSKTICDTEEMTLRAYQMMICGDAQ